MASDQKLPEWPNKQDFWNSGPPKHDVEYWSESGKRDYEHARAEYYKARLDVAVEALRDVEFESVSADETDRSADETHAIAIDALAAIGEMSE